ncbi:MAG: hypothetical protein GYA62_01850, partial [Bacteroidales bacterium]|nr:hypothetical protein [Bacteroidales bacterium]
ISVLSLWDNTKNALQIDAAILRNTLKTIAINGYYYPKKENNNFDFEIKIDKFKLYLLQHYLSSFCSDFRGLASGNLHLYGSPQKPIFEGELLLQKTNLKITYLNTIYSFAHKIKIGKNSISFSNLIANDSLGNEAIINGEITHNFFSNFNYKINIRTKKFAALYTNSSQNDIYYGSGFISGKIDIYGNTNNVYIDINAKTEAGTRIYIPLTNNAPNDKIPA